MAFGLWSSEMPRTETNKLKIEPYNMNQIIAQFSSDTTERERENERVRKRERDDGRPVGNKQK